MNKERVLGRLLSQEELKMVSGGDDTVVLDPITCTPDGDGCVDEAGNAASCEE